MFDRVLRRYLTVGAIIPALPFNIQNGQLVDANPVMANFNAIVSAVNANVQSITQVGVTAFTPTLAFGGGSTGMTFAFRAGSYTQLGNIVFFAFDLLLSAKGSSTGSATIGGLPQSVNANWVLAGVGNQAPVATANVIIAGRYLTMSPVAGSTTFLLWETITNAAIQPADDTFFNNNSEVSGGGWYAI